MQLQANRIIELIELAKKVYSIEILESVGSTNDYLAGKYAPDPKTVAICLAEKQTGGRGTNARTWNSPDKKGIYLSFTWKIENKDINTTPTSIIVGAAIVELLNKYSPRCKIELKWPNDLYANGKKLGGILVEGYAQTKDIWHIIIGIGINVHKDISINAMDKIALADITDTKLDRNEIVANIINRCISLLDKGNFANITKTWNSYDMLKGKTISVLSAGKEYTGENLGICGQGQLNILIQGKIIKFTQARIIKF